MNKFNKKDYVFNSVVDIASELPSFGLGLGGISTFLLGFCFSSGFVMGVGATLALVAAGFFSTKLVLTLDQIQKKADKLETEFKEKEKNDELNKLYRQLKEDKDPRPEKCLEDLRSIRILLFEDIKDSIIGDEVVSNFEKIFDQCVSYIRETDEMWRTSKSLRGRLKEKTKEDREKLIEEIERTTNKLLDYVHHIKEKKEKEVFQDALTELEQSLEIARNTEERLSNLTKKSYSLEDFESN